MLEAKLKIQLEGKTVELEKIFVSELGFTMIKTKNPDGTFTSYNVGKTDPTSNVLKDLIQNNNEYIRSPWS